MLHHGHFSMIFNNRNPSTLLPKGAWDSHVHVIDEERFPLHESHLYRPNQATVTDLEAFHKRIGIQNACLVAVSVYHTDSRSILDALRFSKSMKRAVIAIDVDSITENELLQFHKVGVRGVRINLRTGLKGLDIDLIKRTADKIRQFGWVIQLYLALHQMAELYTIIPSLNIEIVIDHLGSPDPNQGPACRQKGYLEFLSLLQQGLIWTKLSGIYRFDTLSDLDEYVTNILSQAPDRIVWASDWPHTNHCQSVHPDKRQPFRQIDDEAWILQCENWLKDVAGPQWHILAKKIWVDNPRELWQFYDN